MQQESRTDMTAGPRGEGYPLANTAAMLNDRLGLYLSPEQQRGLAAGLMVGAVLGGAILAAGIASALRDR